MNEDKKARRARKRSANAEQPDRSRVVTDELGAELEVALGVATLEGALVPLRYAWGARLFGASLDRKLAKGDVGEFGAVSPLLRERAVVLGKNLWRERIAALLLTLPEAAATQGPQQRFDIRVPLVRRHILACEREFFELAENLRRPLVAVRGVAMVSVLLSDGSGPVYNPDSPHDLGTVLREIISYLDPFFLPDTQPRWL
jgi:hypothetical protein